MSASTTRYMVVGMPRSGTSATHFCLRGHPSVSAVQQEVGVEPFLTDGLATFTFEGPDAQQPGVSALFDAMTSIQSVSDPAARGMKLTTGTTELVRSFVEGMREYLPDVRIILVIRRDLVARFGSLVKAQKTGVWDGMNDDPAPELRLDPYEFAEYVIASHEIRRMLRQLGETHSVMELDYEEVILEGDLPTHESLFEFVDVEPMEADWLWERKFSPPPESYIKNYQQLRSLHESIERSLENGTTPDTLRSAHTRSLPEAIWRKAIFWGRRPGYAAYRLEETLRNWMSKDSRTGT